MQRRRSQQRIHQSNKITEERSRHQIQSFIHFILTNNRHSDSVFSFQIKQSRGKGRTEQGRGVADGRGDSPCHLGAAAKGGDRRGGVRPREDETVGEGCARGRTRPSGRGAPVGGRGRPEGCTGGDELPGGRDALATTSFEAGTSTTGGICFQARRSAACVTTCPAGRSAAGGESFPTGS